MKRDKRRAERFLICRFGGIGDTLILTVIARELKARHPGAKVHLAVRREIAELFENEKVFDRVFPVQRMPPGGLDAIRRDIGWVAIEAIASNYDRVYDMKYSIELNSPYPHLAAKDGIWRNSQNSNFSHWVDLSLGWVNIDPTSVKDKLPVYTPKDEEVAWAKERLNRQDGEVVIGVHLRASSLARTWYRASELPPRLRVLFPNAKVAMFDPDTTTWKIEGASGAKTVDVKGPGGLRRSAALVGQLDLLICADSGYSHIAAALGVPTLTLYTTVPSWTRERYYEKSTAMQSDLPCSPCFTLDGWCPRQAARAFEKLTAEEKKILAYERDRVHPLIAAREMHLPPQAFLARHAAIKQALKCSSAEEPDCMKRISPEMIAEKAKEVLDA